MKLWPHPSSAKKGKKGGRRGGEEGVREKEGKEEERKEGGEEETLFGPSLLLQTCWFHQAPTGKDISSCSPLREEADLECQCEDFLQEKLTEL